MPFPSPTPSSSSPTGANANRRNFLAGALAGLAGAPLLGGRALAENAPAATIGGLQEPARQVSIADDVDVIVCGSGPAGIAAAVMAARTGAKVRLFEVHGCLGGVWTAGLLSYVLDAKNSGFNQEIIDKLKERSSYNPNGTKAYFYDPEEMKRLLEELCVQSGVKVQLFSRIVAAYKDSANRLTTVVTESQSGRQAWKARVFIDATGDGDLGNLAGCEWELGESNACPCQPMTMMAMVTVPDPEKLRPFASHYGSPSWRKEPVENFRKELARFGHTPTYGTPSLFHVRDGLFNLMINHEYAVRADDAAAITEATFRARSEIHTITRGLRKLGGSWDGLLLVATAEQIGVRDGRRIKGRYVLSKDDLIEGRQQEDGVVTVTFNVDIHAVSKKANETAAYHNAGVKTKPYHIPLRALIAKDVDGLMMAGRCISGDFISHASYRVTGNAVAMGEAAGVTAALAAASKHQPHEIEWKDASAKLAQLNSKA
ncbi:FAD-dependent oxidoreductase [Roseimicrobium sp. ORNL1]|uniref:FAD-dependent oxidoreductase n=1 Tax=Roseimicrobium sp. ORNL1 TaxID=2711231 RepID=UPI0013E106AE|nr:FAD-dependent oxidoreductase [Roseimicrobium sp. ORNL1]QIF04961.1 FAD-dependent oxidoreductase [Roseimicrobium sp. ORNL1]